MKHQGDDESILHAFLLGQLPESGRTAIEERIFTDDLYLERLEMAEDDLIDSYVEDALTETDRERFEIFFLTPPRRQKKLRVAMAMHKYSKSHRLAGGVAVDAPAAPDDDPPAPAPRMIETAPSAARRFLSNRPLSIAASIIVVFGLGLLFYRIVEPESDVDRGLALMHEVFKRPTEARITGFTFAPSTEGTRGAEKLPLDSQTKRDLAERFLVDAYSEKRNAESAHALGEFYLADGNLDKAIQDLDEAVEKDASNAEFHSDLGAALLQKCKIDRLGATDGPTGAASKQPPDTCTRAVSEVDRALNLNPSLLSALFNRPLAYGEMGRTDAARDAWNEYIKRDPDSQWTAEAKERVKALR
jgi:anti-sigma factor RsiW